MCFLLYKKTGFPFILDRETFEAFLDNRPALVQVLLFNGVEVTPEMAKRLDANPKYRDMWGE